ncbi:MAG: Y-family DNA polymerase [Candidatus Cloacimonetes bacterium]|nr:Y-family DNA polymerase [Candidatus Cloacimonadota bacterium]
MRNEIFALVDCNNFYASCERVFQPSLRTTPIGVLSNNDGCIVAMSKEMKKLGISRGKPAFKIFHLLQKYNIKLFSSNYALYGDMSARVMKTLSQFTPEMEVYSIDEAFLRLTEFQHLDLNEYGKEIRDTVFKWTGIPVSVGIGRTKTLAKIAARIAKKYSKFNGVFNTIDHPKMDKILETIPVEKVWGIGRQYAKKLKKYGILNAYKLSQVPEYWVKRQLTVVGLRTVRELQGDSCIDFEMDIIPRKEVVASRSFGIPITELSDLQEAVASHCTRAVEKLREQNLVASYVTVYLTTNRFKNEPQYANYSSSTLIVPSAYTPDFLKEVKIALKRIYRPNYNYKKVGVMISKIMHQNNAPLYFFYPNYLDDKRKDIMDNVDAINKNWGTNTIRYAASGTKQKWQMQREFLSPSYTTNWDELPVVR